MSSSTSSSRGFIVPVLVVAAVLIGGYEGLVRTGKVKPGNGMGNWDNNIVRVEKAFYGPKKPIALVGSSLTMNLRAGEKNDDVLDLGMRGGASETGLEVLLKTPWKPQIAVVEISGTLDLGADQKLMDASLAPIAYPMKKVFRSSQVGFKPLNVLATAYRRGKADTNEGTAAIAEQAMEKFVADNSRPVTGSDLAKLQDGLRQTHELVDQLAAAGVTMVLTFIPEDLKVHGSAREAQLTDLAYKEFPRDRYRWLDDHRSDLGRTVDGVHLIPEDADRFRELLMQQVRALAPAR